MRDLTLVRVLGEELFKSFALERLLSVIEKDKSSDLVKEEAYLAVTIYNSINPGASRDQLLGLVVGVLFSRYGTIASNKNVDNLNIAMAHLRAYWTDVRDPILNDVVVASASRVIRGCWSHVGFDLMDCAVSDAVSVRKLLSDRAQQLETGHASRTDLLVKGKTQTGRILMAKLHHQAAVADKTHVALNRKDYFTIRNADDGHAALSIWVSFDCTGGPARVVTQLHVGFTEHAIEELLDPNTRVSAKGLWDHLQLEVHQWLINFEPRFLKLVDVEVYGNDAMRQLVTRSTCDQVISVQRAGGEVIILLSTTMPGYVAVENMRSVAVTVNGVPMVGHLFSTDYDDMEEYLSLFAYVSETPPVFCSDLLALSKWAERIWVATQQPKFSYIDLNKGFMRLFRNWFWH